MDKESSQIDGDLKSKLKKLEDEAKEIRKQIPRQTKKKLLPQSISEEEFFKILKYLKDRKRESSKKSMIAFLLSYEAGLRVSEVVKLKKEDIDSNSKRIFVRQGKYSKDRVVPLPKTWKSYMMNFIPLKIGIRGLEKSFKSCVIKLGLNKNYHYHCLRHSFATRCLEKGMPINQVQLLMGHSNVSTTNVYIQANPIDALNKYEEIF